MMKEEKNMSMDLVIDIRQLHKLKSFINKLTERYDSE